MIAKALDIVWVNARFLTQPLTGIQRYAYNVTKRLPDAQLITPASPLPVYSDIEPVNLQIRPHALKSHLWEQFVLPAIVPRSQLLWSPAGAGPLLHPNHVLTVHDLSFYDMPECYKRSYALWLQVMITKVARRARAVIADSEFTRQRLSALCGIPENKVSVVHLAADTHFQPPSAVHIANVRKALNLPEKYILALGAVSPRKNFTRLLQAWQLLEADYKDVELVIVGERNLLFSRNGSIGNKAGEMPARTRHLCGIDDETLVGLYAGATMFAYPSVYEGFGLPVLEAMSIGTPVLTSCNTSLPEVAGAAALLVDPFSVEEIAGGMRRLLENSALRQELQGRGLARAQEFSWDKTANQVQNILNKFL